MLCIACSSSRNLTTQTNPPQSASQKPAYRITYIIHADANYLYHDAEGAGHRADEKVLRDAKEVAQQATNGEVFIFHQRPEKKFLWLFPKKDRQFLHYKNGKLISESAYSPEADSGVFAAESKLLQQQKNDGSDKKLNLFLYFGHEIPYTNGQGYFSSIPKRQMNTHTFADGIKTMLTDSSNAFDLTVLSTCNNGSPDMVQAMKPYTRFLLASPQNLHLSHIDTRSLSILEQQPETGAKALAEKLAQSTYLRLQESIQTVISFSIYDMEVIDSYLEKVSSTYESYLQEETVAKPGTDNVDCKQLGVFSPEVNFSKGVSSWYRAPRFGKKAKKASHSGWGCKE